MRGSVRSVCVCFFIAFMCVCMRVVVVAIVIKKIVHVFLGNLGDEVEDNKTLQSFCPIV